MFIALLYSRCSTNSSRRDSVSGWSLDGVATDPADCELFVFDMHDLDREARIVTGDFTENKTEDFPVPEDESDADDEEVTRLA